MSAHVLKTWPVPFAAIIKGIKTHEVRVCDRPFAEGDVLHLREYEPDSRTYTGRWAVAHVTYLTGGGTWGLPANLCVMSIRVSSHGKASDEG